MKILLLFLTLLLTISAFGQQTAASKPVVYTDTAFPFSITLPKGWVKSDEPSGQMRLSASSGTGDGSNLNIMVQSLAGTESITPAGYTRMIINQHPDFFKDLAEKLVPGSVIEKSGKGFLGNKEATFCVFGGDYKTDGEVLPVKFYTVQMFYETNLYAVTFTTRKADFEKYYPLFEESIRSFKVVLVNRKTQK